MVKYIDILKKVNLFNGIKDDEIEKLLSCLDAKEKDFAAGNAAFIAGDKIDHIGIVIDGSVQIIKEDYAGNRNILSRIEKSGVFGETFVCVGIEKAPVSVIADTRTKILFIDFRRIITICSSTCNFHSKLIENMMRLIAIKNLALNDKVTCLGHRSTRGKIEAFLAVQMEKAGRNPFEIPFSRAEMADYLCVDRSAMSLVLSKMRDEGLIKFNKNKFNLLSDFWSNRYV